MNRNQHPLQTKEWGRFRLEWGNKVLFTPEGLLTVHPIPFTHFKVGTLIKGDLPTEKSLLRLKETAKKQNLLFIKMEPQTPVQAENQTKTIYKMLLLEKETKKTRVLLKKHGAVSGKTLFTPTTFWIDLTQSEDDLMKGFHSKTRYNIRLAQKKGVIVREDNSDNAFEKYLELTRETVKRQGFYAHSEKYHRLMWKHLHTDLVKENKKPIARLLTAVYKGEILTTWIVFVKDSFLYYPYGASTFKYKDLQGNSLMMWEAILYGKKNKLTIFDLWGREEGKGFTRFKEGFNPTVVHFLGTWDLVTHSFYYPYLFVDRIRWSLLRLRARFSTPTF